MPSTENTTDADLLAAIDRGIAAGTMIVVDDDFLARMAAEIDDEHADHEHCPLHGCVEYVCCVPASVAARTAAPACSAEVEWHSGGPGKSAYSDYRWQCACGNRYTYSGTLAINSQHYAHLATAQVDA